MGAGVCRVVVGVVLGFVAGCASDEPLRPEPVPAPAAEAVAPEPAPPEPRPESEPPNNQAPTRAEPSVQPSVALMVVRLTPQGGVEVGQVTPRPIPWVDALVPYDARRHAPLGEAEPAVPAQRAGARLPDTREGPTVALDRPAPPARAVEPPHHIAVVARRCPEGGCVGDPLVHELLLDPPGQVHGDVVDAYSAGGAVWRVPHLGPGTTWEIVRAEPRPARLGRWTAGRWEPAR
ncbi:MAG: hypothetical protein ACYTF3_09960 [Planctomycetota bacterium]